jgi:Ca-activated chloride channel family protein
MHRDLLLTRSKRPAGGETRRPARPVSGRTPIVAAILMLLTPGTEDRALAGDKFVASVSSRLVLVPVTVTDRNGKPAVDLERQHFRVTEDSQPREIASLTHEEGAVGLGLVVDLSGSMKGKLNHAISATRAIADLADTADEIFLMTFGDRPEMRVGFTRDAGPIAGGLMGVQAYGATALIDAVYRALHEVRASSHRRRALAVISDGGDNASRYNKAELKRLALEADVQINGISIVEQAADRDQRSGASLLEELAGITGGLHFTIRNRADLPPMANQLARAMKDVYMISYKPGEGPPGKWRRIRISVTPPTPERLQVYARSGYFLPE